MNTEPDEQDENTAHESAPETGEPAAAADQAAAAADAAEDSADATATYAPTVDEEDQR